MPSSHASPRSRQCCAFGFVLALLLALTELPAQQFDPLPNLPVDQDQTEALALGDLDGDGDLDLVVGNTGQNRLYLSRENGVYVDATTGRLPADSDWTAALAFGDVDSDGDLDIIVGNFQSRNRLYLNDGKATFTDVTQQRLPPDSDPTEALALGDVDGDGDLDLVFGNTYGQARLYLNDGKGSFTDVSSARLPAVANVGSRTVVLVDVDGDRDLDILLGDRQGANLLYSNDGKGSYVNATANRMPPQINNWLLAFVAADFDADGDIDLFLGDALSNRLYLNDGKGVFADVSGARLPSGGAQSAAATDVDGDGDLDLVLGSDGQNQLLRNDGKASFTDQTAVLMPMDADDAHAVVCGDIDADGDIDVVFGNSREPLNGGGRDQQDRLYRNNGKGQLTDVTAGRLPSDRLATTAVTLGDVDGDGDLDLVLGDYPSGDNRLYLNDGRGQYADATSNRLPKCPNGCYAVVLGDVDGDGDLDLVCGSGGQNRLYLNDGKGGFTDVTSTRLPVTSNSAYGVALVDVDGDRDLDLVCANLGPNGLLLNDGAGRFADVSGSRLPANNAKSLGVAAGDVDGDRDADLVFADGALYLNDGQGSFSDATQGRMPAGVGRQAALGDVDGDGDLDVLLAGDYPLQYPRLYLNGGKGAFTDATQTQLPAPRYWSAALAFGDVDEDGDLDIVLANYAASRTSGLVPQPNQLYLNGGKGTYTDASQRLAMAGGLDSCVALGDVDADGDLDLVFGNISMPSVLQVNLLRQLDSPSPARIGKALTLDAYARFGAPRQLDAAVTYLATAAARIAVPPYGILGLDPRTMVALPAVPIPQPDGMVSIRLPIPNDKALANLALHAQALAVPYPLQARLTNVTLAVVR